MVINELKKLFQINLIMTVFILVNLLGCSSIADLKDETKNWTVERLYSEAKEALDVGAHDTAIKYYELLEVRDPYGKYAQQAQLELIYAYYKFEEPESALVTAKRFIYNYPNHPHLDYVYYMRGLINFERNQGMLSHLFPLDRSQRDQSAAFEAFSQFAELIKRFPNSKYSQDARQRMIYLRNMLAEYELNVAQFYLKREAYLAAANRAKKVVESYQRTPSVPEALVIMAKAYKIMELNDLSESALKVLKLNYPQYSGIGEVEKLVVK
jgi:outer membrane protein assembly factor BamD